MQHLGRVTNHAHNGLFVILCDASAQYGGWDDYGEVLGDDGSMELALGELRAYVEEGDCRYGGAVQVYRGNDGVLWIAPAAEPGIVPCPPTASPTSRAPRSRRWARSMSRPAR